jgi:hypothetical protein
MRMAEYRIEEWLHRNRRKIIACPYQPGNLRITLWGCRQRMLQAKKLDLTDFLKSDYFDYAYRNGLVRCRDCPISNAVSHRSALAKSLVAGAAAA